MNKKTENYMKLGIVALFAVLLGTCFFAKSGDSFEAPKKPEMKMAVKFSGTQFIIKNGDEYDYKNCRLKVNDKYKLKVDLMEAGHTYEVGIMTFADDDGNRFTMLMKPQEFSCSCRDAGESDGFYYGTWN